MKCMRKMTCRTCPSRKRCPASMRRDKRARRAKTDSASNAAIAAAASVLETGWFTCYELGVRLFGEPKPGKSGRMNIMVRARRPVNRLKALGVLAVRPNAAGAAAYTLTDWPEGVPR